MTADETATLRAALNNELGFYPASLDETSIARYRRQAAADSLFYTEYLRQYGPDGYRRNQYRHLVERKRQEAVEGAAGRAAEPLKKPRCV